MKKIMMATALIVMVSALSCAIDDTPENRAKEADRYMAVAHVEQMFQDIADQMAMNLPMEQREELKDLLTKHLDIAALEKAMKEAMVKHFTAGELKALADFYGSPDGKSATKKFPMYMAEVMPAVQAERIKAQAKASREKKGDETRQ